MALYRGGGIVWILTITWIRIIDPESDFSIHSWKDTCRSQWFMIETSMEKNLDAVFTKTKMNNKVNFNFLQNNPLGIQ